jgi:hypothetical protein
MRAFKLINACFNLINALVNSFYVQIKSINARIRINVRIDWLNARINVTEIVCID